MGGLKGLREENRWAETNAESEGSDSPVSHRAGQLHAQRTEVLSCIQMPTCITTMKLIFTGLETWKVISKIVSYYRFMLEDKRVKARHSRARLFLQFFGMLIFK